MPDASWRVVRSQVFSAIIVALAVGSTAPWWWEHVMNWCCAETVESQDGSARGADEPVAEAPEILAKLDHDVPPPILPSPLPTTGSNVHGLDLNAYCLALGPQFRAELIGPGVFDWRCLGSRGEERDMDLKHACLQQHGLPNPRHGDTPMSWYCTE